MDLVWQWTIWPSEQPKGAREIYFSRVHHFLTLFRPFMVQIAKIPCKNEVKKWMGGLKVKNPKIGGGVTFYGWSDRLVGPTTQKGTTRIPHGAQAVGLNDRLIGIHKVLNDRILLAKWRSQTPVPG